jgi:hypothetical protein
LSNHQGTIKRPAEVLTVDIVKSHAPPADLGAGVSGRLVVFGEKRSFYQKTIRRHVAPGEA